MFLQMVGRCSAVIGLGDLVPTDPDEVRRYDVKGQEGERVMLETVIQP
jgi:hypothetical protein